MEQRRCSPNDGCGRAEVPLHLLPASAVDEEMLHIAVVQWAPAEWRRHRNRHLQTDTYTFFTFEEGVGRFLFQAWSEVKVMKYLNVLRAQLCADSKSF